MFMIVTLILIFVLVFGLIALVFRTNSLNEIFLITCLTTLAILVIIVNMFD